MKVTYTNVKPKNPGVTGPLEKNLLTLAPYAKLTKTIPEPKREADVIQFPFVPLH